MTILNDLVVLSMRPELARYLTTVFYNPSGLAGPVPTSIGGTGLTDPNPFEILTGPVTAGGALQQISIGSAGQLLQSNGPGALPSFINFSGGLGSVNIQIFTSVGDHIYTPTTNTQYALVIATGGGAGGGGATCSSTTGAPKAAGSGGGAGDTRIGLYSIASIGATVSLTIGARTSGGAAGLDGVTGNPTYFGSLIESSGGFRGVGANAAANNVSIANVPNPFSPTGSGGLIVIQGGLGDRGFCSPSGTAVGVVLGGRGGISFWGVGGIPALEFSGAASAGRDAQDTIYGAGGGGATANDNTVGSNGGDGMSGVVIVLEFIGA